MEKFVATVFLLGVLATVGLQANGSPRLEAFKYALADTPFGWIADLQQTGDVTNDSLPKPPRRLQKIVREEDGKRVEMEVKDGKVTRLNIDGREIPDNELAQHRGLTRDLMRDIAPPPPPLPPVQPVPGMPAMPPVPPMPPMPEDVEGLGFQFFDGSAAVSRLSTTKDAEGNTMIRLDQGGKPVEIVVKNGEVWVDGKRVENDGVVELPKTLEGEGFNFNWNDNQLIRSADGENFLIYENGAGEPSIISAPGAMHMDALMEMERSLARSSHGFNNRALSEKDRAKIEKDMQKAEKELQKAHKEMEKQHRKLEEQHRKLEESRADRMRQRSAQ